ncbi:hypothetical protein I4F81_008460 [Pyropia yezoensis]|uniref:Uncharacterized protein n=1 Tax=Pyropia yezoensis TaxID=2788 RepID=A0ACC3C851_PYRYE|nr:hypothetical protein I4F81_008460 [Neopyropia yezoensis]
MNDDDDGSDQDMGVDGLDGDTTTDEERDPAQEQAYVQDARNKVTLKRAVLAANLSRLQGVSGPPGVDAASSAGWFAAFAQVQQAAKDEETAGPLDGAGEDLVAAITDAAEAVSVYCGGRAAASVAEVELAARTKTAAWLIGVAAAGLPLREAATDAPPARKEQTQTCGGCGEPGHKLGAKAAKDVLAPPPAATAARAGSAACDTERRLAQWAAARFRVGTADKATPGRRGLDRVPQHLAQALAQRVAVMRAAIPPSVAGLFPATPAKKRRWWAYVPFLRYVLNVGVESPYDLIPGARAVLHCHGTLVPDKMLALLRAVSVATGMGVRGHPSLRAWPELRTGGAAVLAAMAGVGGRANRAASQLSTDGVAVTFFLSRPDTAAEAEARAVAWAKKLDGGGRAQDRSGKGFASRGGVLTQLERAGLPLARVRWLQMVGGDPGRSAVLSASPGERVATADLPARPVVDVMRAA